MTIEYTRLSDTDYSQRRFQVISLVEGKGGKPKWEIGNGRWEVRNRNRNLVELLHPVEQDSQ